MHSLHKHACTFMSIVRMPRCMRAQAGGHACTASTAWSYRSCACTHAMNEYACTARHCIRKEECVPAGHVEHVTPLYNFISRLFPNNSQNRSRMQCLTCIKGGSRAACQVLQGGNCSLKEGRRLRRCQLGQRGLQLSGLGAQALQRLHGGVQLHRASVLCARNGRASADLADMWSVMSACRRLESHTAAFRQHWLSIAPQSCCARSLRYP